MEAAAASYARRAREALGGALDDDPLDRRLLAIPDVAPSCHVLLLDPVVGALSDAERDGLLSFVRAQQDVESGAWLGPDGEPSLSNTTLGWWVRVHYGDDPDAPELVRAARVVRRLGGAQRADVVTRIWLAAAGAVPWSFLPSIPAELWLAPEGSPISPTRISPWARDVLTAYFLLSRVPARVHLTPPHQLLLRRDDGDLVPPRLTRPGLAGDLLQAFDRTVKLARKIPRGPVLRRAVDVARSWLSRSRSAHGGWFGTVPTVLGILALRCDGARSNDPRILAALDYLRRCRGRIGTDGPLAQALAAPRLADLIPLVRAAGEDADVARLLAWEISRSGPWQVRADAGVGGFSYDVEGDLHVDTAATALAVPLLQDRATEEPLAARAMAAIRRSTAVVVAMQEADGSFARFERGETRPPLQQLPWQDADHLAHGRPFDDEHLWTTALALRCLARTGYRYGDDRVGRSLAALERRPVETRGLRTVAALVEALAPLAPEHPVTRALEHRLRTSQREDGGFGDVSSTAWAITALLATGSPCVQVHRAVAYLADRAGDAPPPATGFGLGPSTTCELPAEPDAAAAWALGRFLQTAGRSPAPTRS